MAERFTADLLFILFVLLLAALLGLLIGWLVAKGRSRKRIAALEEETETLKAMVRRLEARLGLIENENKSLMAKIADQEEDEQALRGEARKLDDENDSLNLTIGRLEKELAGLRDRLSKESR
jgi:septal ring factor EnvC (AmiA/AmiB activator)